MPFRPCDSQLIPASLTPGTAQHGPQLGRSPVRREQEERAGVWEESGEDREGGEKAKKKAFLSIKHCL